MDLNTIINGAGALAIVGGAVWWLLVGRRKRPACHVVAEAAKPGAPKRVALTKLSLGRRKPSPAERSCCGSKPSSGPLN